MTSDNLLLIRPPELLENVVDKLCGIEVVRLTLKGTCETNHVLPISEKPVDVHSTDLDGLDAAVFFVLNQLLDILLDWNAAIATVCEQAHISRPIEHIDEPCALALNEAVVELITRLIGHVIEHLYEVFVIMELVHDAVAVRLTRDLNE